MNIERPVIALTMGDPCGVGPEIVARTLVSRKVRDVCTPLAVGDRRILNAAAEICGIKNFEKKTKGLIEHVECETDPENIPAGRITPEGGRDAYECILRAHQLCENGKADAVATAPINKESLRAGKIPFIGHTEIFASLCGADDPLTMFETDGLRIFFLTRHVSLRKACDLVTKERVYDYIVRCTDALVKLGLPKEEIKLAAAGLNPHSGEHGLFGDEEEREIAPAVLKAQNEGFNVAGPVSADSVFHQAHIGRYTAVLSLYHDQGHIAAKTLDFERTISLTHGLPYLRTSVDHGTAFDIAWKGLADSVSMAEAAIVAAKYCRQMSVTSC